MQNLYDENNFWNNNKKSIEQKLIPIETSDDILRNELIQYEKNNEKLNLIETDIKQVLSLGDKLRNLVWKQEDELFYAETLNESIKDKTIEAEKDLLEAQSHQFRYYKTIIGAGIGGIISVALTVPLGVGLTTSGLLCMSSGLVGGILGYKS
jgi:hypothetical protein